VGGCPAGAGGAVGTAHATRRRNRRKGRSFFMKAPA
jgi:hypothetical protein